MLFEPYVLAGLKLENRVVRSATYEKLADEDGHVTEELIDLYRELAQGGSGLIITGFTMVHPSGRAIRRMLSVHSDLYTKGLTRLTEAVHAEGGRIALQIAHGGRQCPPVLLGGKPAMAPSAVYDPTSENTPKAMDDSEIWTIIDAFADAAFRARTAGFDAVQLHGAHGYLISSFLSPHTNRRDDYWGGDEGRRFHFVEEVLKAVREAVGQEFPLLMKLNCDDLLPDGIAPEEAARITQKLEASGLDAVEVSGGMRESEIMTSRPDILKPEDEAYFRTGARLIKQHSGLPVILTGGMRSRAVMEDVIQSGDADMVGLSRPLIREPDLPNKMRDGKELADCISCNKCRRFSRSRRVECALLHGEESQEGQ